MDTYFVQMQTLLKDANCSNLIVLILTLGIIFLSLVHYILINRRLPPGPVGIPVFGYWPFLKSEGCHLQLQKLGEKYGRVFSFKSTGRLYINLGSAKSVREALLVKSDCFAHRLEESGVMYDHFNEGIIFLKGEPWKIIKKFLQQQLRERGLTVMKEPLSSGMYGTIRKTIDDLKKENNQPIDIASLLLPKCNSVMLQTLFGEDGLSEQELKEFCESYMKTLASFTIPNVLTSGKIAKYFIFPFKKETKLAKEGICETKRILRNALNRRKTTYDENNIRDIFDAYLKERNDRRANNDPSAVYFTDDVLIVSLIQIVGDGTMFMSMFIADFINALLNHPDEQNKIYEELIDVIGTDRDPTIEDKNKLSYTNAFIFEVLRCSNLITIMPTLQCTKETTIENYRIPKEAVLLYNLWMVHMNPNDYEQPEVFNPSRYIMKNGGKRPELPLSFGMGKRSCIGEGFAMIQVFLYLTTIVKHFYLAKHQNKKTNELLKDFKVLVCAQPRNEI